MLKDILNLEGAQKLNKKEQGKINGGGPDCNGAPGVHCNDGSWCCGRCKEVNGPSGPSYCITA